MQQTLPQQEILSRRLPFVVVILLVMGVGLLLRMVSFQALPANVISELNRLRDAGYMRTLNLAAARGFIYDRDGEPLAVNTLEYRIGISPNLVAESERRRTATELASILGLDELETYELLQSDESWVLLAPRVDAEVWQQLETLDLSGITNDRIPRRTYPQGTLASQIIGFVGGDLQGYYGIEGYYQDQLAGQVREEQISNIPFDVPQNQEADHGTDIVLTIDRDVQFIAERELLQALAETGATSGTIIIMNPRNGDILAVANSPSFDPNAYFDVPDAAILRNPAIGEQYEPGSVMKVITMAAGLESGIITPQDHYVDQGRLEVGGVIVENWDRASHGDLDMTQILVQSLNVGAATISTRMGPTIFYTRFTDFGFGRLTGVDLEGEAAGTMYIPGDPDWSESQLGTNSFGQGIAVTPLQMLTAVSAIANDGLMMRPRVVYQLIDGDQVITAQPSTLGRPISAETASIVTEMMVATVRDGVDQASVAGYTIAGKSGTAEIPTPIGYENNAWIMSFVGFLPADDPQVSIIIKLDRPTSGRWASGVVAPIFQRLCERLVIQLEIPTDDVRNALAAEGGAVNEIQR
jgi:cell division protein FtsI (penicillin-binding protein 3)